MAFPRLTHDAIEANAPRVTVHPLKVKLRGRARALRQGRLETARPFEAGRSGKT
jgi:hypothetical protein